LIITGSENRSLFPFQVGQKYPPLIHPTNGDTRKMKIRINASREEGRERGKVIEETE